MINKLVEKLRFLWNYLNLREKLLALYIFSFIDTRDYIFTIGAKKILFPDIIFVFLVAAFLAGLVTGKGKGSCLYLVKSLTVMVLLFMISFLHSINLKDSFVELFGLIYLITLFTVTSQIITARSKLNIFLYLWLFIATCISLVGLSAFGAAMINKELIHSPFLYYSTFESMANHFPRIHSTFNNANMFCTYLHVSLVFAFILFFSQGNKKRNNLIIICMLILFITAFLTGSRRLSGLLLSAYLILCWYGKSRIYRILRKAVLSGFIFFFLVSVINSVWVIFPARIIKDKETKTISLKIDSSYSLHFIQLVTSLNMFKKHPFMGVGLGTYNSHFRDYVDWEWLKSKFGFEAYPEVRKNVADRTLNFDPHSAFLGALAETGIIGFLGLLYLLISYSRLLGNGTQLFSRNSYEGIVTKCVFSGFLGFLLIGIFTDILSMRHFWFLMAVGLSVKNAPEK